MYKHITYVCDNIVTVQRIAIERKNETNSTSIHTNYILQNTNEACVLSTPFRQCVQ